MSVCTSCGAAIVWAVTPSGARMPVDAEPVPDGNVLLNGGHAVVLARTVKPAPGVRRHTSHFSTCPNAAAHRMRGKAKR